MPRKLVDDARIQELMRSNVDLLIRHLDQVLSEDQVEKLNTLLEDRDLSKRLQELREVGRVIDRIGPSELADTYKAALQDYTERIRPRPEPESPIKEEDEARV